MCEKLCVVLAVLMSLVMTSCAEDADDPGTGATTGDDPCWLDDSCWKDPHDGWPTCGFADDCAFDENLCIQLRTTTDENRRHCTQRCQRDDQCPDGRRCIFGAFGIEAEGQHCEVPGEITVEPGDTCTTDLECSPHRMTCRDTPHGSICTTKCFMHRDCASGHCWGVSSTADGNHTYCSYPDDPGHGIGLRCEEDAECVDGLSCLLTGGGVLCVLTCEEDAECPLGASTQLCSTPEGADIARCGH